MQTPFEDAVRRHGPTVLRVCLAVLGAGADADDAWQDTFLSALRAWPDLEPDANVEAWLVRIARNRCIDLARRAARHATPTDELPPTESRLGVPTDGEPDLWRAVAALPEKQRLALAYHYFGGLPHTETAELTGSTPAAVRRAAADGLAALRRTYGATHD